MDRQQVFLGQVPMDTDILNTNLNAYIAIAKVAAAIFGTSTQLNGLACTATSPASLSVNIGEGEIYQLLAIDTVAYGSLAPNANQILKQGIQLGTVTTAAMTAPVVSGQSINYLIEFTLSQVDNGSQVLPYYNSANPSQAFSGPNNDAQPNYTNRSNQVGIQVKAGTAATSGMQTTPSPDSGYVGGWVVTIAYGQTTITSGNIALYPGAPFLPATIDNLVSAAELQSGQYLYAADSSVSANTVTAALTPAITAYAAGELYWIKIANTNTSASTININTVGSANIKLLGGGAINAGDLIANNIALLCYDGTNFELLNPGTLLTKAVSQTGAIIYASDSGTANAYAVTLSPVPASYTAGLTVRVLIGNTNTSTSTLNINSLGTKNITKYGTVALAPGDIVANEIAVLTYDGTQFQLINPFSKTSYAADSGSANAYAITLAPALPAYYTGFTVRVLIANTNTTTSTLNVNSLGTKNITKNGTGALLAGDILANMLAEFVYDGTEFQLINPVVEVRTIKKQVFTSSGAYTPSSGMIYCMAEAVGGGGGGGGCASSTGTSCGSGGGGGGGYGRALLTAAQIGSSQTVTIGAAGTAGANTGTNGGAGGTTSLGSLLVVTGGAAGIAATASATATYGTPAAGGSATTADFASSGGPGGTGFSINTVLAASGNGGSSVWGGGGIGAIVGSNPGTGFGGGGSGGAQVNNSGASAGGVGTKGAMYITEYCTI